MGKPTQHVHSLHCTACDEVKDSITMELCPKCEQAMLRHFPVDFFKQTKKSTDEIEELQAIKILAALELAAIESPTQIAA